MWIQIHGMHKKQVFRGPECVCSEHELCKVNIQNARPIAYGGANQTERLQSFNGKHSMLLDAHWLSNSPVRRVLLFII